MAVHHGGKVGKAGKILASKSSSKQSKSKTGQLYVIVVLTDEIRANYLKEAVNILLEIYGV